MFWLFVSIGLVLTLALILLIFSIYINLRTGEAEVVPEPQYIGVEGHRLAYWSYGQGPTLVLLHGLGASSYSWRFVVSLLQQQFKVVTLDLLGFGLSDRPADFSYNLDDQVRILHEALKKIAPAPAVIVGSSMGGNLALWLHKQFPLFCENYVLLAPAVFGSRLTGVWARHSRLWAWSYFFINPMTLPWLVRAVVGTWAPLHRNSLRHYGQSVNSRQKMEVFLRATACVGDARLPECLATASARVLLLWGSHDRLVPAWIIDKLAEKIPHVVLQKIAGGSHHPHEQFPEQIATAITNFYSQRPASLDSTSSPKRLD